MNILLNFLVKIVIQNSCVKFDAFLRQNDLFIFPPKRSIRKQKRFNTFKICISKKSYLVKFFQVNK